MDGQSDFTESRPGSSEYEAETLISCGRISMKQLEEGSADANRISNKPVDIVSNMERVRDIRCEHKNLLHIQQMVDMATYMHRVHNESCLGADACVGSTSHTILRTCFVIRH